VGAIPHRGSRLISTEELWVLRKSIRWKPYLILGVSEFLSPLSAFLSNLAEIRCKIATHNAIELWRVSWKSGEGRPYFRCGHNWTLQTWRSWIRALWYNYENNQQDALYRLIYYSKSALHVSGNVFAHRQEHLTVFTVSGSVHPTCCRHHIYIYIYMTLVA